MRKFAAAIAVVLITSSAYAQNDLVSRCPVDTSNTLCRQMAEAAEAAQARTAIALSGGNPVLGASSTLGMRLGALPRISIAGRITGAQMDFQDVRDPNVSDRDVGGIARSLNLDAALGVFSGFSLLPTIGGFGSIDVLGSYGRLSLPDEFGEESVNSWALGVRLGILRESFTAPGVALTGMYRSIIDGISVGSLVGPGDAPGTYFTVHNASVWSGRATVGKRILMLGAVAGVGYDKFRATGEIRNVDDFHVTSQDFNNSRTTVFTNVSWTMLLLHIVGEGGIQQGGDDNGYYGSLAIRLAL